MIVYHRTFAAKSILSEGFKDATGNYLTDRLWSGVWLSNVPLDINEGAAGDYLLSLDIPEDVLLEWEWVEEDKPYREFLVPANVVNQYGPPVMQNEED